MSTERLDRDQGDGACEPEPTPSLDAPAAAARDFYIVGIGAFHMLLAPARKQLASGTGDAVAAGRRLALGSAVLDVVLVVNLALMVFKPD